MLEALEQLLKFLDTRKPTQKQTQQFKAKVYVALIEGLSHSPEFLSALMAVCHASLRFPLLPHRFFEGLYETLKSDLKTPTNWEELKAVMKRWPVEVLPWSEVEVRLTAAHKPLADALSNFEEGLDQLRRTRVVLRDLRRVREQLEAWQRKWPVASVPEVTTKVNEYWLERQGRDRERLRRACETALRVYGECRQWTSRHAKFPATWLERLRRCQRDLVRSQIYLLREQTGHKVADIYFVHDVFVQHHLLYDGLGFELAVNPETVDGGRHARQVRVDLFKGALFTFDDNLGHNFAAFLDVKVDKVGFFLAGEAVDLHAVEASFNPSQNDPVDGTLDAFGHGDDLAKVGLLAPVHRDAGDFIAGLVHDGLVHDKVFVNVTFDEEEQVFVLKYAAHIFDVDETG